MVKEGKLSREKLDMGKRMETAQVNSLENFLLFIGSLVSILSATLPDLTP
jgi:hypothetical protein